MNELRVLADGTELVCKTVGRIETEWALWFLCGTLVGLGIGIFGAWCAMRSSIQRFEGVQRQLLELLEGGKSAPAETKVPKDTGRPN